MEFAKKRKRKKARGKLMGRGHLWGKTDRYGITGGRIKGSRFMKSRQYLVVTFLTTVSKILLEIVFFTENFADHQGIRCEKLM